MNQVLDEALPPLAQRLVRLHVVEADQVDEDEHAQEGEDDEGRRRQPPVGPDEALEEKGGQEEDGEDVGQVHRAGDLPANLLEGDAEERREEEEVG